MNILDCLAPIIVDPHAFERAIRITLENIVMKLGTPIEVSGSRLACVVGQEFDWVMVGILLFTLLLKLPEYLLSVFRHLLGRKRWASRDPAGYQNFGQDFSQVARDSNISLEGLGMLAYYTNNFRDDREALLNRNIFEKIGKDERIET